MFSYSHLTRCALQCSNCTPKKYMKTPRNRHHIQIKAKTEHSIQRHHVLYQKGISRLKEKQMDFPSDAQELSFPSHYLYRKSSQFCLNSALTWQAFSWGSRGPALSIAGEGHMIWERSEWVQASIPTKYLQKVIFSQSKKREVAHSGCICPITFDPSEINRVDAQLDISENPCWRYNAILPNSCRDLICIRKSDTKAIKPMRKGNLGKTSRMPFRWPL